MKPIHRAAHVLSFVIACSICNAAFWSIAKAQTAPLGTADKVSAPTLIQQMVGTWKVQQRMWPGAGAEAIDLPPAVAHRHLMAGGFLQEVMEPANKAGKDSFTRTAYLNYNAVSQQYEYFSLDSRAPQMMNERSEKVRPDQVDLNLNGGTFVAPQWGEAKNVAFMYRLTVGEIKNNGSQVVRLYLTPQTGESHKEFLAFEYVYTRKR